MASAALHAFPRKHNAVTAWAKRVFGRVSVPESARRLAEMPLTLAGLGLIDAGIFTASSVAGLIVLGAALIGLEYIISDGV